jgi:hypothetical protein
MSFVVGGGHLLMANGLSQDWPFDTSWQPIQFFKHFMDGLLWSSYRLVSGKVVCFH